MRLKDKLSRFDNVSGGKTSGRHHGGHRNGDNTNDDRGTEVSNICRSYNRGRCSFGRTCRYDHRCSYCFKFGHAIINCRKLAADKNGGG